MKIEKEKNVLYINGKKVVFDSNIDTILEFSNYCIVLLMNDDIPDNNVEAIDYDGNRVWNISSLIIFPYSESYISISKITENLFSTITYSGVKFVIDTETREIIEKGITK